MGGIIPESVGGLLRNQQCSAHELGIALALGWVAVASVVLNAGIFAGFGADVTTVLTGGVMPEGKGFFYPPTVLTNVPHDSRAGCEELFGPVAIVEVVQDLDEAIALANATPWGLGGSIWATDPDEVNRAIAGMEAGMIFANTIVASTPELPFGGIKRSGYGRELSAQGIREFTNVKTFYVA